MKPSKIIELIVLGGLIALLVIQCIKVHDLSEELNTYTPHTDTVTIHNWVADTIYQTNTKYVKLPVVTHDTITNTDTITTTDSVLVEVPISTYQYDTVTLDSTHVRAVLSGFQVKVDSLSIETKIVRQEPRKWHWGWGMAIGYGWVK